LRSGCLLETDPILWLKVSPYQNMYM
jgi:hypothetical protein